MDQPKFDLNTHSWDNRGRLRSKNMYRAHVVNGTYLFERPVNSGNLFYENNAPAGRVECKYGANGAIVGKTFNEKAEHKAYEAPISGDEKLHFENKTLHDQNVKLQAELEAIRAEKAAKTDQPAAEMPSVIAAEEKKSPPVIKPVAPPRGS